MKIQLSDHFTYGKLFRFCLSPIIMMVFTSIYGVVDGLFVSNFVGKTAFASLNFVTPFIMVLGGMGFRWAPAAAPWWPGSWAAATGKRPTATLP